MGLIFSVVGSKTAVTVACDLMTVVPAAGKPVALYSIRISQNNQAKDANDAMQRIQIVTGNTTAGSGGAAATPSPIRSPGTGAVASSTCTAFNTTLASAGTAKILLEDNFDVRAGWLWIPTPEERIEVPVTTNRVCIRLPDAPAASTNYSITVNFEEIG